MRDSRRARGTECSREPSQPTGSFEPVGLFHLPVGITIWDSTEP
jgi:hypothetical protein